MLFAGTVRRAHTKMAVVEFAHLRSQPRRHMHPISDVPDGHRVLWLSGIQIPPHGPRHFAVQRRHRVGMPRELQAQNRHAELLLLIVGVDPPEAHQVFERQPKLVAQRPTA